jgi:hypothetical protein
LRALLRELPFDESPDLMAVQERRLARLRQLNAPSVIIENEELALSQFRRPSGKLLDEAPLEELRSMLVRWNTRARTCDLSKLWDVLHWFCDEGRRQRVEGDWRLQRPNFQPSEIDFAIHGFERHPSDAAGQPIIVSGGMKDADWYNPPEVVRRIAHKLAGIDTSAWKSIDAELDQVPHESQPYFGGLQERFACVTELFPRFCPFYRQAADRGFGVSVEFY